MPGARDRSLTPLMPRRRDNQVEHHLLQLYSISLNERQVLRESDLQRDAIPQHFAARQGDDF
jgi:hypothetical protein